MGAIAVVAPLAIEVALPPDADTRRFASLAELARAGAGGLAGAVILSDSLPDWELASAAAAVRALGVPCVEVRSARWDGETWSPLSAACRGVISGFGPDGVRAAVALLADAPA